MPMWKTTKKFWRDFEKHPDDPIVWIIFGIFAVLIFLAVTFG